MTVQTYAKWILLGRPVSCPDGKTRYLWTDNEPKARMALDNDLIMVSDAPCSVVSNSSFQQHKIYTYPAKGVELDLSLV